MGRNVMLYVKTPFDGTRSGERTEVSRSHRLLGPCRRALCGRRTGDFEKLAFAAQGKPYFPACPQIHFSISHSGAVWACAMAADEIGLDVQKPRAQNAAGIARRFFHPLERAYLERWGADAFFRVWAAKESVCKYRGTGIDGTFSHFSVSDGACLLTRMEDLRLYHFTLCGEYAACLCTEGGAVWRTAYL